MPVFVEIIIRTFIAFILVWTFVHQLGKQMIAQKTYHVYVASVTLGTIAGNLAFNTKIQFQYFILSFVIMAAIVYILNILAVHNRHYGKYYINGKGCPLVYMGRHPFV